MTSTQILTPLARGDATVELSADGKRKLFRKQILPKTTIRYKGRSVTFDEAYLRDLKAAFDAKAFDQVPFQLADERNTHTNDPERYRGHLVGVELTADGLDGLFDLTPEGAAVVEKNPNLGVSARIIENLERADGKTFPRATQHVLGTLDPRVTGMRPWQTVDLAAEAVEETIDLSGAAYPASDDQEGSMPTETNGTVTLELSRADAEALKLLLADHRAALDLANGDPGDTEPDPEDGDVPPPSRPGGDVEPDPGDGDAPPPPPPGGDVEPSINEDDEDDDDDDEDDDDDDQSTSLSSSHVAAVELAHATASTATAHVLELARQLRAANVEKELDRYRNTGLSPAIIEAARPVFEADPQTIELSNGATTDSAQVMRDVLNQVIQLASTGHDMLDLNRESGVLTGSDATEENRAALLTAWDAEYPV